MPHPVPHPVPTDWPPPSRGSAQGRVALRMHLFERCASLLLDELGAREQGDRDAAEGIRAERDALRGAWEDLASAPGAPVTSFGDALDGAVTELAHRELVEARLREHLLGLGPAAGRRLPSGAASPGVSSGNPAASRRGPRLVDGTAPTAGTLNLRF